MQPVGDVRFAQHDEYTHYYYAQAIYILGEDGYGKLFPESKEADRLKWSTYRADTFPKLKRPQTERRQLDRRPRRPAFHHRRPSGHHATGQRLPADLPTLKK